MTQTQWTEVDDYITALLIPPDPALDAAIQSTIDRNLQPINVAPNQGKLLHILALTRGAHTILDLNVQGIRRFNEVLRLNRVSPQRLFRRLGIRGTMSWRSPSLTLINP